MRESFSPFYFLLSGRGLSTSVLSTSFFGVGGGVFGPLRASDRYLDGGFRLIPRSTLGFMHCQSSTCFPDISSQPLRVYLFGRPKTEPAFKILSSSPILLPLFFREWYFPRDKIDEKQSAATGSFESYSCLVMFFVFFCLCFVCGFLLHPLTERLSRWLTIFTWLSFSDLSLFLLDCGMSRIWRDKAED